MTQIKILIRFRYILKKISQKNIFFRPKCIAFGSHHQGELPNGGQQCTCVILVFLASAYAIGLNRDVDRLLELGTDLFTSIGLDQHLLISELPPDVSVENRSLAVTYLEPRSGLLSQTDDNSDALSFSIASALERSLFESNSCFVTIGNDPGVTIGIFKQDEGHIYVFDSHSRDKYGRCCPNGKAVLLQLTSLQGLLAYVKNMSRSLSASPDLPFEITPVTFSESDLPATPPAVCHIKFDIIGWVYFQNNLLYFRLISVMLFLYRNVQGNTYQIMMMISLILR